MGRYWSVEECSWVTAGPAADPDLPVQAEQEDGAPAVPEQRQAPQTAGFQQG